MKRWYPVAVGLGLVFAVVFGVGQPSQPVQPVGTQTVLLMLPERFHDQELELVLQQWVNKEADIYVTSEGATDEEGANRLKARIPERFFDLMPGLSGGPRVTVIPLTYLAFYDKVVVLGYGWYSHASAASGTGEADTSTQALYDFLGRQLADRSVVGAIGAGIYPLVSSGVLPQGSEVPAYPCPDLSTFIQDHGYEPRVAPWELEEDAQDQRPLVHMVDPYGTHESFLMTNRQGDSWVVMSPIPNTWYPDESGAQLVSDYGDGYMNTSDAMENLFQGVPDPTTLQIGAVFSDGWVKIYNTVDYSGFDLGGWTLQSVDPATGEIYDSFVLPTGEDRSVYAFEPYTSKLAAYGAQLIKPGNLEIPPGCRVELLDPYGNRRSVKSCCHE